jgi:YD repeat-containing protein
VASADYAGSSSVLPATIVRTSHATYDTSSHCLTSTDANGNTTSYAYDSLGDCTMVSQPDGTHEQLVWSPRSNLIQETDANGTTITNVYDLCDRLVHRDIAAHGAAVATTTFETCAYDGGSRLVLASNDVSRLDFHYDSFGDCTGGSQDGLAQSATYDSEGNPLSLTYPSGRVVTYAYDALDQVTNIATAGGGVSHPQLARFAYAGPGRLARIGRDNGIITRIDWDGLDNPANSAGDYGWQEVSRVRDGSVASPSLVMDRAGTYSRTQSKTALADAVSLHNLALTYDPLEQLVESSVHLSGSPQLDTLYALDAEGNRQHVITNGVTMLPDYAMSSALPPGDFFMNRYTTTPFGGQSYDANGNLMVRTSLVGPTFYHYDYADRLVEVDALSTLGTLAPVATFTYDALGRRISKTTYPGVPAAPVTTQYVYDVVEYKDGEDGTMRTRHGCILEARVGGILNQSYVHTTGLKEEIRENDNVVFTATGEAHYYHCDDLGNTLALTDAGGTVLERYAYDDYGQPKFLSADGTSLVGSDGQPVTSSPLGNPFLFHSLMWDGETGLLGDGGGDYFDPQSGRYLFGLRGASLIAGAVGKGRAMLGFTGNNPWSGGGGEMQKGTVKFFNEAKGFGFMTKPKPKPVVKDRPLSGNVTLYK